MYKFSPLLIVAAGLVASVSSQAQPGPGAGPGACPAASAASGPNAQCGGPRAGMGPGGMMGSGGMMGRGMGPGARWGKDYTPGWGMMSRDEQQQHRDKMRSFQSYDECKTYMEQHHGQMTERAKERGRNMPAQPRRDACAGLKEPAPKK